VAGRVKTRLAGAIGNRPALQVYLTLTDLTRKAVKGLNHTSVYLFYSDEIPAGFRATAGKSGGKTAIIRPESANWHPAPHKSVSGTLTEPLRTGQPEGIAGVYLQYGSDLGRRMLNAFQRVKLYGHRKICIIGTDCPDISTPLLNQAFHELENHDLVAGPAADGGYYLLGMKEIHSFLFRNKEWSTASVLQSTLDEARKEHLCISLLQELYDIDDLHDLKHFPEIEKLVFHPDPDRS
jgi:rSAM/selenodomain-associated transferase 1